MLEATRNSDEVSNGPIPYIVLITREAMQEGKRVVQVWETGIEGSFSDCCAKRRGLVVPSGYELVLKPRARHITPAERWFPSAGPLRTIGDHASLNNPFPL